MSPAILWANIPRSPLQALSRFADAARLLKTRGLAMQTAVPVGQGAMAALLGVGKDVAEKLAAEAAQGDVCQLANDNEPTQAVISGSKSAIDRAALLAKAHGVRRFMPLNVSAPFHCALMQPAATAMAEALAHVDVKQPAVPLIANVLAAPISDPAEIKRCLVEQVTGTVRWRECVAAMAAGGVTEIYEIGSGKVLAGLAKRIVPTLNAMAIGTSAGHRSRVACARTIEDIMFELTDRTALVTGATGGIGGAIARALHKQGASVAVSGRQKDKLEKLAAELGSRVHVLPCDLADKAQVANLVDQAIAKLGRLDILVNNAGLTKDNLFMVMKDEQWDDVIAVNLTSTFMLMRAAARAMMRAKTGFGRIVNISSVSGIVGNPGTGQLRGLQGRHHRHVEVSRPRGGVSRDHGELHRAGVHLDPHDGRAERETGGY